MTLSIHVIDSAVEFHALRMDWNVLAEGAVDSNTFLTHDWLHTWWQSYRPDARLAIVVAGHGGRIVGIAPMMLMRQGTLGRVFRRLRFIGDGTSETDHMNFIIDRNADRYAVLNALLDAVNWLSWDIAHFSQLPELSANTAQVLDYARTRGWLLTAAQIPCPRRTVPTTYDELLRSLPSRLRTSIRSSRRTLAQQYVVEFGQVTAREQLQEALDSLYRNHTGRWQARGEGGVFANPQKRAFYSALSERLLDAGRLRFFHLKLDGRIVAQQYCFQHEMSVLLLQEGFDVAFSHQNVGNVLRAMVFEWMIEQRLQTYDFLAGTSRHKESWSDSMPNDLDIRVCRPTLVGRAAFNLPRLLRQARAPKQAAEAELAA